MNFLTVQAIYYMGQGELLLAEMPWKRVSSWGPHFGTLTYRRSLWGAENSSTDDYHAVSFRPHSEAEDFGFAQEAVRAGAGQLVRHVAGAAPSRASRAAGFCLMRATCPSGPISRGTEPSLAAAAVPALDLASRGLG